MRGFQIAKKVAVSLKKHLIIKRFVILYLLIVIAFHLTAPTTAHYTYEEKITGEMFVSDQLEETEEPDDAQTSDQEEEPEIDTESDQDHNQAKSNESENQKGDMADTGKSDEVDHGAATQSEKAESEEAEPVDQQTNGLDDADVSGKEEEEEQVQ